MAIEIEADQVGDFFEDVKEDIKDKLRAKVPKKATDTLQEQEEKIFERQEDSEGQKWKNVSMLGLLSRDDNVKQEYNSVSEVLRDTERRKSLRDEGKLFRSLTDGGSKGVSSFTLKKGSLEYEFGTRAKGAHTNQFGGQGSGMTSKQAERAIGRLEADANRLVSAIREMQGSSGDVPEREFLYWTREGVKEMSQFTVDQLEKSVKETMSDYG